MDNFWSSDNFSNRYSYSCNKFSCRSSFTCTSTRGDRVRISYFIKWTCGSSEERIFSQDFWPTDNSAVISVIAPKRLSWLTEIIIWRSNSIIYVLSLKCIDVFPSPLNLHSPLSKTLIPRNTALLNSAKVSSTSLEFSREIHMFCNRKFRPTSFQIQILTKITDHERIFLRTLLTSCLLFTHNSCFPFAYHTMSLNIDTKMILLLNCSGSKNILFVQVNIRQL